VPIKGVFSKPIKIGDKFGLLTVIDGPFDIASGDRSSPAWLCRCSCKNRNHTLSGHHSLVDGKAKSCGCVARLKSSVRLKRQGTHGMSNTPLYWVWTSMIARCTNPNQRAYASYGGRGIMVCDRWLKFIEFYRDMGHAPAGMSLDRIDNNKGYSPENCRWATQIEQMNNIRANRILECDGQRHTVAQWSRITGIKTMTILSRLSRGSSDKSALTEPLQNQDRRKRKKKEKVT